MGKMFNEIHTDYRYLLGLCTVWISLSIEGYYVGSKNTVFWDVSMAVPIVDVFWDFVPHKVPKDIYN
jgi:hypothetical protein